MKHKLEMAVFRGDMLKVEFYMVLTSVVYIAICMDGIYHGESWMATFQGASSMVYFPDWSVTFTMNFDWPTFSMAGFGLPTRLIFGIGVAVAVLDDAIKVFRAACYATFPEYDFSLQMKIQLDQARLKQIKPILDFIESSSWI